VSATPAPTSSPPTGDYQTVPMDRLRRVTARRMRTSATEKPHVTLHRHVDVDALMTWRRQAQDRRPAAQRSDITMTAVLVFLVARAFTRNNRVNGRVENDEIRLYEAVHMGVAIEVEGGLVVPVIHDASRRELSDIGSELKRLARAARSGSLRPEDVSDGTFTITNLGSYGVEFFTPIINPPQLAILGVGVTRQVTAVRDGESVISSEMGLSLSFDHAASDGSDAARALDQLVRTLSAPNDVHDGPDQANATGGDAGALG